jgi:CubicO group peptidase (beta-lactamase class C family)
MENQTSVRAQGRTCAGKRRPVGIVAGLTLALAACAGPGEDVGIETRSAALTRAEVDGFFNTPTSWALPSGQTGAVSWKYTTTQPASSWKDKTFNDASWLTGQPGFAEPGAARLPQDATLRTTWAAGANKIWLRKTFTISAANIPKAIIWARWDDRIKVYINGVLTAESTSWTPGYRYFGISSEARATLSGTGSNTVAVEVQDDGGGKYFDLGIALNATLQSRPVVGVPANPELTRYTQAVQRLMVKHGIPAASLAVMKGDDVLLTQGFGWKTKAFSQQVPTDAVMRIASIDKMLAMFAAKKMIRDGVVDPLTGQPITEDTPAFPLMLHAGAIDPNAGPYNQDMNAITVGHLIHHVGGIPFNLPHWTVIEADLGKPSATLNAQDNIIWIYRQPLTHTPGTCPFESCYSNNGYAVLRYLVQSVTGGDLISYLRNDVLARTGNDDVVIAHERLEGRDPREPWYATLEEPFDRWVYLENGLVLASSAELLVRSMRYYHNGDGAELLDPVTGQYQPSDNGVGVSAGGFSGTTSFAVQRRWDELSFAVIFNISGPYDPIVDELMCLSDGLPDSAFNQPGGLTLKPLFSFENAWEWTSPQAALDVSSTSVQHGSYALAVPGIGFVRAVSREFDTCEILDPKPTLKLDVFIPPNQPNPSWLGTVAVELECPAVSHYRFMGPVSLTGKAQGQYHTLSYTLGADSVALLDKGRDQCRFAITLNANANSGSWRFDKLRFE